jgi:hypothetical protein
MYHKYGFIYDGNKSVTTTTVIIMPIASIANKHINIPMHFHLK